MFGVLALGWDGAQILLLYWCENIVAGLLTLPRILGARGGSGKDADSKSRRFMGLFFPAHYGIFCLVHGVFAFGLAGRFIGDGSVWDRTFGDPGFLMAVAAVFCLHLLGLLRDLWSGAVRRADPFVEMFKPYGRIIVMHVTVLALGWALTVFSAPAMAVLILCLVKTWVEIAAARRGGLLLNPKASLPGG